MLEKKPTDSDIEPLGLLNSSDDKKRETDNEPENLYKSFVNSDDVDPSNNKNSEISIEDIKEFTFLNRLDIDLKVREWASD